MHKNTGHRIFFKFRLLNLVENFVWIQGSMEIHMDTNRNSCGHRLSNSIYMHAIERSRLHNKKVSSYTCIYTKKVFSHMRYYRSKYVRNDRTNFRVIHIREDTWNTYMRRGIFRIFLDIFGLSQVRSCSSVTLSVTHTHTYKQTNTRTYTHTHTRTHFQISFNIFGMSQVRSCSSVALMRTEFGTNFSCRSLPFALSFLRKNPYL